MSGDRLERGRVAREFGSVLREARDQRGISQETLAELADFDRTYPSLLERGLRSPTLTVLLRLAEALNIKPARLVTDTLARLRGEGVLVRRRLYPLAYQERNDTGFTLSGRACLSFEQACHKAIRQNAIRGKLNLPAFTHVAVFEEIDVMKLATQLPE